MEIKVVIRADKGYPKKLKAKLRGGCPPLFYYAGDLALLEKTVRFVNSRTVGDEDAAFAEEVDNIDSMI